jgi:hypothetical protein
MSTISVGSLLSRNSNNISNKINSIAGSIKNDVYTISNPTTIIDSSQCRINSNQCTISGVTLITNTTNATRNNDASLVVCGGAGINKDMYIGGFLNVSGVTNITNTTNTTNATDVTTGALVVGGGVSCTEDMYVGGTLYNSATVIMSDKTLKCNFVPIKNSLDKVCRLQGLYFNWLNSDNVQIGFIAQDVEKIVPELVVTNKHSLKCVNYSQTTALLVEAIKEQQTSISYLNQQNIDLKKRIELLENY